jgi:hypothetical protein
VQTTPRSTGKSTRTISRGDIKALAEASRNVALVNKRLNFGEPAAAVERVHLESGSVVPRSKAFYSRAMPTKPAAKKVKLGRPPQDEVSRSVRAALRRSKGVKLAEIAERYHTTEKTMRKRISDDRKRNAKQ